MEGELCCVGHIGCVWEGRFREVVEGEGTGAPDLREGHVWVEVGFGEGAAEGAEFIAGCGEEEALEVSDCADKWRGCLGETKEGSSSGEFSHCQEAW